MRMKSWIALAGLFGLLAAAPAAANIVRTDNVEAELVSSQSVIAPGQPFTVALRQDIREHWHTYWKNPGDSGEATHIALDLPAGWTQGEIVWPAPMRLPFGPLVNYGFEGEILLPLEITPPPDLDASTVTLTADATWLVCNDVCIPEDGSFTLDLMVAQSPRAHPLWADRITDTLAAAPQPLDAPAVMTREGATVHLHIADAVLGAPGAARDLYFFPETSGAIEPAEPQPAAFYGEDGLVLELTPGFALRNDLPPLPGVLGFERRGDDGAWTRTAVQVNAAPGALPALGAPLAVLSGAGGDSGSGLFSGGSGLGLLAAVAFAFIGGLILNLMPCVFPVLSLKALTFAERAHNEAAKVRRDGLMFLAGVLVSFAALALALIALRGAGAAIGWGFQLQSPAVVAGLALLFFAIALNLIGAFEFGGGRFQNFGSSLAEKKGPMGAFFVGVLAVIVATPCTAPFMGAALGYAMVQPAWVSLAIFLALGAGLAAPFVLLAFSPPLLRLLPRPGPWMVRARQLLAFPMAATAIWLVWVLSLLAGADGVAAALLAMLAFAFAVWAFGAFRRRAGVVLGALGLFGAAASLTLAAVAQAPDAGAHYAGGAKLDAEPWSPELVQTVLAEGRPVFVDFTAAWCVTCQVNERTTLSSRRVVEAFANTGAAYLVADWTARDAAIEAELAKYGRSGVPLYLVFSPGGGEPVILPQILTERRVASALQDAAG